MDPLHVKVLAVFLDPVLAGYVQDFEGGVSVLRTHAKPEDHRELATLLCELSRDVLFRLPFGELADATTRATVEKIADLFEAAAVAIKANGDSLIMAFQQHIRERAKMLRRDEPALADLCALSNSAG